MFKPWRIIICTLAFTLVVATLTAWLLWSQRSGVTLTNIGKIAAGMTRTEVEAILGGPPQFEPGGCLLSYLDGDSVAAGPLPDCADWVGPEHGVTVHFQGDCVDRWRLALVGTDQTLFGKLRRWLHW